MRKLAFVLVLPFLPLTMAVGCDPTPDSPVVPSQCVAPTGAGTQHGTNVTTDETWTAAASPHVIPYDIAIRAKLTLEPCAVVQIAKQKTVTLDQPASVLVAAGVAGKPVTITSVDPSAPYAQIRLLGGATASLDYTNFEGGGDRLNTLDYLAAVLQARGDQTKPTQPILGLRHVKITGSLSNGLMITEGAGFTDDSTDVVVTGAAAHPIHTWARAAGTIPPGTYTGNALDTILLDGGPAGQGYVHEDTMFHDRGIPYEVGTANGALESRFDVDAGTGGTLVPLLTIEPGVVIRFQKGQGKLLVGTFTGDGAAQGALRAVGTSDKKIRFTSAAPNPQKGDWLGIWFARLPDPRSKLDNVIVEYAGSDQGKFTGSSSCTKESWGAIRFLGYGAPSADMITNVSILHSGKNAIDRGWRDDPVPDFSGNGNVFDDIGGCVQTTPKDHNGACPNPVPCP